MKRLFLLISLFSQIVFAQKGVKNEKELAQSFLKMLQTRSLQNLEAISAPAELYPNFVEIFKEKTKQEIQEILAKDTNNLSNKLQSILQSLLDLEVEHQKISLQKVEKPQELYLIAKNYYQIPVYVTLNNAIDTFFLEAYKYKKRWYWTDLVSAQPIPLHNILKKNSKYSAEQYKEMAKNALEQKEYRSVIHFIQKLDRLGVQDNETFYYQGLAYKSMGDTIKAVENFRKAYYQGGATPEVAFELFSYYAKTDLYYDAYFYGDSCLENEYKVAEVIPDMIRILEKDKKLNLREETKMRENPYFFEQFNGRLNLLYKNIDSANPSDKVKILTMKAEIAAENEKWAEAKEYLSKAIAIESENFDLLYELAWLENETQNYAKALEYAQRAYKIKKDAEVLAEMAYSKMKLNDFKGAIADYNMLFAMGEEFITARKLKNRGNCYRMLKNNKRACADYQKALQMGEDDTEVENWVKKNCR
ncbi:MAG: tetratricopeptide repeat protein [Raineya sp.]|nr:tetratricopeptide repeat protein [Raineya sp.]MDW8295277.1 tetratricopeptide repeat protein [Raineya sp.]